MPESDKVERMVVRFLLCGAQLIRISPMFTLDFRRKINDLRLTEPFLIFVVAHEYWNNDSKTIRANCICLRSSVVFANFQFLYLKLYIEVAA